MRIDYFSELVCFAKHLSVATAAEELYLSPSTLSKHISELEKMLGVPLVNHGRTLSLTNIGNAVLEDASYIVQKYESMQEKCASYREKAYARPIRVLDPLTSSSGVQRLYSIVFGFLSTNPHAQIQFIPQGKFSAFSALKDNIVDVLLKYDYEPSKTEGSAKGSLDLVAIPLSREPLLLWCRKDSVLALKDTIYFKDLENATIMSSTSKPSPLKASIVKLAKRKGFSPQFATYSSLTESEFFLKNVPEQFVYIVTPLFAQDLFIKANDSMVIREFEDNDVTTTCFLLIRSDQENEILGIFAQYATKFIKSTWSLDSSER